MDTAERAEESAEKAERKAEKMLRDSGVEGGQRQEERQTSAVLKAAERAEKAENRAAAEESRISRATEREMKDEEDEEKDVKAASDAADSVDKYRKKIERDDDEAMLAKAVEKKALAAANREKVFFWAFLYLCEGGGWGEKLLVKLLVAEGGVRS